MFLQFPLLWLGLNVWCQKYANMR